MLVLDCALKRNVWKCLFLLEPSALQTHARMVEKNTVIM